MSEILKKAQSYVGKSVDFDKVYGAQCADFVVQVVWDVLGQRLTGNAIDAPKTQIKELEFIPEQNNKNFRDGDILIEFIDSHMRNYGQQYGHISIIESIDQNGNPTVLEQNFNGEAFDGKSYGVQRRKRKTADDAGYGHVVGILRQIKGGNPMSKFPGYSSLTTRVDPRIMPSSSRAGKKISHILVHHNAGTSTEAALNTWAAGQTSAHYQITPNEIIGCIEEPYAAWHAGTLDMNQRSIGLEHLNSSGAPRWEVADATLRNSAKIIADICKRYNLPVNANTIIPHRNVVPTQCPGGIDMNKLIRWAQEEYAKQTGKITPDPKAKPDVSDKKKITISRAATHWSSLSANKPIHSSVKGKSYYVAKEQAHKQSRSNKAILLENEAGVKIGWLLEQDVEGFNTENSSQWIPEKGRFILSTNIYLHIGKLWSGNKILLKKGDVINYDAKMTDPKEGHVWIRQPRANGGYGYLPTGQSKNGVRINTWGTFK